MASRGVYDLGPSRQQGGCRRGGPTRRRNRALRWARSAAPAGRVPGPRVRRPTGRRRLDTRASGRAGPATGTHIRVPPRLPGGDAPAEPGRPRVSVVRGPVKAPVSVPGGARDATASYRVGPATRLRDAATCPGPRGHGAWPVRVRPVSDGHGLPGPARAPLAYDGPGAACNGRRGTGADLAYTRPELAYARPDRVCGRPPRTRPRRPAALSSGGSSAAAPPTAPLSRVVHNPLTRSQRRRNTDSASESALPPFPQPGTMGLRASPGGWLRRASPVPLSPHRVPDVRGRRAAWRSAWPKESAEAPWCPP